MHACAARFTQTVHDHADAAPQCRLLAATFLLPLVSGDGRTATTTIEADSRSTAPTTARRRRRGAPLEGTTILLPSRRAEWPYPYRNARGSKTTMMMKTTNFTAAPTLHHPIVGVYHIKHKSKRLNKLCLHRYSTNQRRMPLRHATSAIDDQSRSRTWTRLHSVKAAASRHVLSAFVNAMAEETWPLCYQSRRHCRAHSTWRMLMRHPRPRARATLMAHSRSKRHKITTNKTIIRHKTGLSAAIAPWYAAAAVWKGDRKAKSFALVASLHQMTWHYNDTQAIPFTSFFLPLLQFILTNSFSILCRR